MRNMIEYTNVNLRDPFFFLRVVVNYYVYQSVVKGIERMTIRN